ncbi:MAG: PrpF domain-containing protein [Acidimicrobiales bacterium]
MVEVPAMAAVPGWVNLPVVLMRGGTSKGVFLRMTDLPPDRTIRDGLLLRLMGSPDPMQLDGLGGSHSSTSKVMAVGPAADPGTADVDYLFAQVAIDAAVVDYTGNCGNLTAAVAHYAVDEALVAVTEPYTTLRMRNLNTNVVVQATVAVHSGRAAWMGDTVIDGVPGSGAPLVTEYLDPAGSVTGALFPTGERTELLGGHEVSLVDVASPYLFVRSSSLGLRGDELPAELNTRPSLLAELEAMRTEAGRRIGVDSLAIPRMVLLSEGRDLRVQATSMGRVHHALPMTGALCTAAAARLAGTVVHQLCRPPSPGQVGADTGAGAGAGSGDVVRICHPKGAVEATVRVEGDQVRSAGVVRTARRLLSGTAHL